MKTYYVGVVGDSGVGKTSLTTVFNLHHFAEDYRNRLDAYDWTQVYDVVISEPYRKQVVIDDEVCLILAEDFSVDDSACIPWSNHCIESSDAFLIVYSVAARSSFDKVKEIKDRIVSVKGTDKAPILLVGNKCDLKEREVSFEESSHLAKSIGCDFIETSAKAMINVEDAFFNLVRLIRQQQYPGIPQKKAIKKKLKCSIQ